MATINPRKDRDGNVIGWQAIIRKRGYPALTRTFRKKVEAEAWATVTEAEMVRGVWQDRSEAEETTLGEALERYRKEITALKKGRLSEEYRITALARHALSKKFLAGISGADLSRWRDFQQVPDVFRPHGGQSPVVQDNQIDLGQGAEITSEAAVTMTDSEFLKQTG